MMARSVEANMTPNVVIVYVPDESERLEQLRAADVPRLVVVAAGTEPPTVVGDCEEWIRFPADAADVLARLDALKTRATRRGTLRPSLDNEGLLRFGAAWVALSATDEKLATIFLRDFGHVIPASTLLSVLAKDHRRALNQPISRFRQRIEPLGLTITFVHPRGYLMHNASGTFTRRGRSQRG
jgi:DNA-binding response OmpR family regulator